MHELSSRLVRNKALTLQKVGCSTCSLACQNPDWEHAQALIEQTGADKRVMLIFTLLLVATLGLVLLLEKLRLSDMTSLVIVAGLLVIPAGLLKLKSIIVDVSPAEFLRG